MGQGLIQLGWIPYWNLLPLHCELQRLAGGALKVMTGHPSVVSRWLAEGTVQLAPASSIALFKSKQLEMALPLGIASDGPVQSVYIGIQREHEPILEFIRERQLALAVRFRDVLAQTGQDMRQSATLIWSMTSHDDPKVGMPKLRLTPSSAASAALTQVLMNLWFGSSKAAKILATASSADVQGQNPNFEDRPMELVIGDEALQRRHEFWRVLDLGQVWFELTGLPFVFGLWQTASPLVPQSIKNLVAEAASLAQARMSVEPQAYFPETMPRCGDSKDVNLAAYWKVIQYKLTDRHIRSLLLYFSLYHQACGRADDDAMALRFFHWDRAWGEANRSANL